MNNSCKVTHQHVSESGLEPCQASTKAMPLAAPPPRPSLQPCLPSWLELGFCHPHQHSGCTACQAPSISAWSLQCPFCFLLSLSPRRPWTGLRVLPFSHSSSHRVLWKVWKVLLPLHCGGH